MKIDWNKVQNLFISRWIVFLVFFVAVSFPVITFSYFKERSSPSYTASVSLFLLQAGQDSLMQNVLSFYGGYQSTEKDLITAILNSNSLAEKVVYEIDMNLPYWKDFLAKTQDKSSIVGILKGAIRVGSDAQKIAGDRIKTNSQIFIVSATMADYDAAYDVLNSYLKALANFLKQNGINTSYFVLDPSSKVKQASAKDSGPKYIYSIVQRNFANLFVSSFILGSCWILWGEWRRNKFANLKL